MRPAPDPGCMQQQPPPGHVPPWVRATQRPWKSRQRPGAVVASLPARGGGRGPPCPYPAPAQPGSRAGVLGRRAPSEGARLRHWSVCPVTARSWNPAPRSADAPTVGEGGSPGASIALAATERADRGRARGDGHGGRRSRSSPGGHPCGQRHPSGRPPRGSAAAASSSWRRGPEGDRGRIWQSGRPATRIADPKMCQCDRQAILTQPTSCLGREGPGRRVVAPAVEDSSRQGHLTLFPSAAVLLERRRRRLRAHQTLGPVVEGSLRRAPNAASATTSCPRQNGAVCPHRCCDRSRHAPRR